MQLPTLAKVKFFSDNSYSRHLYRNNSPEIRINIPTVRFTSHAEWQRTLINYNLRNGDTVVAVQEQAYNYGRYSYSKNFHILPLIAILTGITKKAAIKWKHCKAYYPAFQMQELTYLDGTPWISEEQIKKEEDEYNEKMKAQHAAIIAQKYELEEVRYFADAARAALQAIDDIPLDFLDDPPEGALQGQD